MEAMPEAKKPYSKRKQEAEQCVRRHEVSHSLSLPRAPVTLPPARLPLPMTSPNSTTSWKPGVQMSETIGDISHSNHCTWGDIRQSPLPKPNDKSKSPPPRKPVGLLVKATTLERLCPAQRMALSLVSLPQPVYTAPPHQEAT